MSNLFRKDIEKRCAYCRYGSSIGETEVVCVHKGITDALAHCRRFAYDPLKRTPPRPAALETKKHTAEDFAI